MNLLIDIRYLEQPNTGIAVGLKSILEELKKYKIGDIFLLCNNKHLFSHYEPYYNLIEIKAKLFSIKEHFDFYRVFKEYEIDIFYSHHFISPLIKPTRVKVINVIHDLIPYYINVLSKIGLIYYKFMNYMTMKSSDVILTNSYFTKQNIIDIYGRKNVKVIYHSYNKDKLKNFDYSILDKLNLKSKNYFLFVSSLKKHKNYINAIKAFNVFNKKNIDYRLVLVGKKDNNVVVNNKNIIFTDYISDEELNALYKNATALLFISFIEGFGVPILEAQYHGCPVIASNQSSLPEVAGNGAIYVNPNEINSIIDAMNKIMHSPIREDIIYKGLLNINNFSWEKYVEKLVEVFKGVK